MARRDRGRYAFAEPRPAGRWKVILACAVVASVHSLVTVERTGDDDETARLVGSVLGSIIVLLGLPAVPALISMAFTRRWHVVFATFFAIVYTLSILSKMRLAPIQ